MKNLTGYLYYPDSLVESEGIFYFLVRGETDHLKYLGVMGSPDGFHGGHVIAHDTGGDIHLFPTSAENMEALRQRLPWLRPQPLGLQTTAGFGDRLGLATPGHVWAVEDVWSRGGRVAPIFAQQSVRENARTHRTPRQVMDDAAWGVFQTGWRTAWGADADHLKTPADVDDFFTAGFTFFTIDPGEHVDNAAQTDSPSVLRDKAQGLPWDQLQSSLEETLTRYANRSFEIEGFTIALQPEAVLRALAKYGRAVAHTLAMSNHLTRRFAGRSYDLEVSVDETEIPTSAEEHFLIASELTRLGVRWVSLAPRFVGRFEKGVDYLGDLAQFEREFACHAAIARYFSSYRLSLHSGSDKFSVYPIAAHHTHGLLHLKTAGTSYLEALRVIGQADPVFFRKILHLAIERYETDRASYHVSASLDKVADPASLPDSALASLLDQFDARQVFHVTFGAALDRFGQEILDALRANENAYYEVIKEHFIRHIDPITRLSPGHSGS